MLARLQLQAGNVVHRAFVMMDGLCIGQPFRHFLVVCILLISRVGEKESLYVNISVHRVLSNLLFLALSLHPPRLLQWQPAADSHPAIACSFRSAGL